MAEVTIGTWFWFAMLWTDLGTLTEKATTAAIATSEAHFVEITEAKQRTVGSLGQHHVGLSHIAYTSRDYSARRNVISNALQGTFDSFSTSTDICFDDQSKLLLARVRADFLEVVVPPGLV